MKTVLYISLSILGYAFLLLLYWPGLKAAAYIDSYKALEAAASFSYSSVFQNRWTVTLSFYLGSVLWSDAPYAFRVVNIAIHLINSILLFRLLKLMFRFKKLRLVKKSFAHAEIFLVLIWMLHPIHYSVNLYFVQRSESLAATFAILAIHAFLLLSIQKDHRYLVAFLICLMVAFQSKMSAITVPLIAMVLARVLLARSIFWYFRNYKISIIACMLALFLLVGWATDWGMLFFDSSTVGLNVASVSPISYLLVQSKVLLMYMRDILYPIGYILDYHWRKEDVDFWLCIYSVPVFGGVLAAMYGAVWRKNVICGALLAGYFALLPSSGLMPLSDFFFHHRVYLASFFLLTSLFVLLIKLFGNLGDKNIKIAMAILLLFLSARTYARSQQYGNLYHMYDESLKVNPCHTRALMGLAEDAMRRGDHDRAFECVKKVILCSDEDYYDAQFVAIAKMLVDMGRSKDALDVARDIFSREHSPETASLLLSVYFKYGDYNKAAHFSYKFLDSFPSDQMQMYYSTMSLIELESYGQAMTIIDSQGAKQESADLSAIKRFLACKLGAAQVPALNQTRDYFDAYLFGRFLYEAGQYQLASTYFERSLDHQPNFRGSMILLAKSFIRTDIQLERAKILLDTVILGDKEQKLDVISAFLLYFRHQGDVQNANQFRQMIQRVVERKKLYAIFDDRSLEMRHIIRPEVKALSLKK